MKQEQALKISHLAQGTQVLGPGNRAVIWVHGCCFSCPGCLAERYKTGAFTDYSPQALADWYLSIPDAQGLTVSGGEPMLQARLLAQTIRLIRAQRDTGVIIYTGFTYEDLLEKAKSDPGIGALLDCTDLLIDGPYLQQLDDGGPYRGSSNQRLLPFTDRYLSDINEYYSASKGRQIEIHFASAEATMIGVPDRDQLTIWRKMTRNGDD